MYLISFPSIFLLDYYLLFYTLVLLVYFLVVIIQSIKLSLKNKLENFLNILPILIATNITPGYEIFFGLFHFIKKKGIKQIDVNT